MTSTTTMRIRKRIGISLIGMLAFATAGFSQDNKISVKLTPSLSSPEPVGQQVLWTATVTGGSGRVTYRFMAAPAGSKLNVMRDFSPVNTFPWSELTEGVYHVVVQVRDLHVGLAQVGAVFTFTSRVTGTDPVVSPATNPLVAIYSAPSCAVGSSVSVTFSPTTGKAEPPMTTASKPCDGRHSLNFYVAGMLPKTSYNLQQTTTTGSSSTPGPTLTFQTGVPNYKILPFDVTTAPNKKTSSEDILLMSFKSVRDSPPLYPSPTAVDLHGNVLWYYWDPENPVTPQSEYLTRPVAGGTFLVLMWGGAIREVDLDGNIIRETNVLRMAEQLSQKKTDTINWMSHEALRLPNGHTVTLGSAERILPEQGNLDVVGDMIIDLDENFQVAWSWSSFDFLNKSRTAILGEKCGMGSTGVDKCGHLKLATVANDWTHANSLLQTSDGNLLLSLRNQDYVLKVDYNNATGDGHIIWTMGPPTGTCVSAVSPCAPTFTLNPPKNSFYQDTYPWFSHQHDVEFDGTNYELYDNGNTRVAPAPIGLGSGNSRGYVFSADETNMTITVLEAFDLGSFNPGFGSAQLLENGNYTFTNGTISDGLNSQVQELLPKGTPNFRGIWRSRSYRSFRLKDLYTYTE
jgi:arylsulfate sulfotransferase